MATLGTMNPGKGTSRPSRELWSPLKHNGHL